MFSNCFNYFQGIKDNPLRAAAVGSLSLSLATNLVLYAMYAEGMLFNDMNEYAAQGVMAAIGLGSALLGAAGGALAQKTYSHCSDNDDDLERAAINTPRMS